MKTFMMTTAIVAVTSFGAFAQTATTTGQATTDPAAQQPAQTGQMDQQRLVPAFLASDFTGKNLYTLDDESVRVVRDERLGARGTVATDPAAPATTATGTAATAPAAGTATQPGVTAQPGATTGVHPQARYGDWDRTRMRWETGETFAAQRDRWNNVGDIADIVMTADGDIHGILIDVGGFLGIGARTVMVDIDELHFVLDHEGGGGWFDDTADEFFIVAAMSEAELEALPEWDDANLRRGFETRGYYGQYEPGATMGHDGQVAQQEGRVVTTETTAVQQTQPQDQQQAQVQQAQPQDQQQQQQVQVQQAQPQDQQQMQARTQQPEGYQVMAREQLTVDTLQGADVYDAQNQQIGNVEDLVLAADGTSIEAIVLDIGGFLGIGQHRVALQVQEVDIFHDQQQQVRVQVPMTQQELEQLPEHQM
jgi:sporulation protein YlmC with PRC-barrel domain